MGRGAAVCNLGLLPHRTAYCRALSRHYLLLHSAACPEPPYLAVLSALHRFRALKMKQGYRCGLLPHPIAGQPGIFQLIPSLARKTHHSTVSWRQVGWHPAMNTRACFCSNIKKIKTHFRLDSNQHLRIISSAFCHLNYIFKVKTTCLLLVSFYGAPKQFRPVNLLHGKETLC